MRAISQNYILLIRQTAQLLLRKTALIALGRSSSRQSELANFALLDQWVCFLKFLFVLFMIVEEAIMLFSISVLTAKDVVTFTFEAEQPDLLSAGETDLLVCLKGKYLVNVKMSESIEINSSSDRKEIKGSD